MSLPRNYEQYPDLPITEQFNGSKIAIHDIDEILGAARRSPVRVYSGERFPHPIENVAMDAEIFRRYGNEVLGLCATIALDKNLSTEKINDRFKACIALSESDPDVWPLFEITNCEFPDTYVVTHTSFGSTMGLWFVNPDHKVIIANTLEITRNTERRFSVSPPALKPETAQNHLGSLSHVTAAMVDFFNALTVEDPKDPRVAGVPLRHAYEIGRLRKPIDQNVGPIAVRYMIEQPKISKPAAPSPELVRKSEMPIEQRRPLDGLTLQDIGGLQEAKQRLSEVLFSYTHPDIFEKWGVQRPRGILLYGPPGTGKTLLVQAFAAELGAELSVVKGSDVLGKWLGESERAMRAIFEQAAQRSDPSVIFFDELDAMIPKGNDSGRNAVAAELRTGMDALSKDSPVIMFAATNNLEKIDPSVIRPGRFDLRIEVPMPDESGRREIFANLIARALRPSDVALLDMPEENVETFSVFGDDLNLGQLAKESYSLSGADINEILRRLRFSRAMAEASTGQSQSPIAQAELELAIRG